MAKHGPHTSKCRRSGDLCTAPLLSQRLGAAALLKRRSVLSHQQPRAQSSSHRCGLRVLGTEGTASACGAVPADLCWELSTYGCGDSTAAGLSCLHGHAALNTSCSLGISPRANSKISHWLFPAGMKGDDTSGRAAIQGALTSPWLKGLFATSSDNRNFRLLIH